MVASLKHKSASVTLRPQPNGKVWIANLYSENLRQGHARELMQILIDRADKDQMTLQLDARAYGHTRGMNTGELIVFYESFGFIQIETHLTKHLMERPPRSSQE